MNSKLMPILGLMAVILFILSCEDSSTDSDEEYFQFGKMVYVPAGSFDMGRDGDHPALPIHTVYLNAFYIGAYEVTQREWVDMIGINPSEVFTGDMRRPVEDVTWFEAVKYCNYLSIAEGLTPVYSVDGDPCPDLWYNTFDPEVNWYANGYRLPTEAEWEYAARGATNDPDYLYAGSDDCDDVAWYTANTDGMPEVVGLKQPNGIGTYDQSGNVSEWCWDLSFNGYYSISPSDNPHGPDSTDDDPPSRIARGGAAVYDAFSSEVSYRRNYPAQNSGIATGLRVCRNAED